MQKQDKYRIALLSAYALALHAFEFLLPKPIPWLRLGLANIITLTALWMYGFRVSMYVTLVRVLLGSVITGTFLGPAFILSLGGGLASTSAMGFSRLVSGRLFGPVGISLIGALFHNAAQLALAYVIFVRRFEAILLISPVIFLAGTLTGFVNGLISDILIRNLLKNSSGSVQNVAKESS